MRSDTVPHFYLYGEPHRAVEDGFIHVEYLDDRSRPSDWTIRPHAHADLMQMFVIADGGGRMLVEDVALDFTAPALLLVPPGVVHGFSWESESSGSVLTIAQGYFAELVRRYPDLAAVFAVARVLVPTPEAMQQVSAAMATLMREWGWSAPGHRAAVDAASLALCVAALRLLDTGATAPARQPDSRHTLVARFRARVEERFRLRESMASYAAALGTSESRLRAACAHVAAMSPAAILDQRAMLEARRALLYSTLSIAEIGYAIGFADPAYFSRFFLRNEGRSPSTLRRARSEGA